MTERLQEVLDSYLRYHRIEGSTVATVKFYAKELGLFLRDLTPDCRTIVSPERTATMETYIGKTISDFTLQSSDGQTISLSSLRGQKVLLYFFTSPGGGN